MSRQRKRWSCTINRGTSCHSIQKNTLWLGHTLLNSAHTLITLFFFSPTSLLLTSVLTHLSPFSPRPLPQPFTLA